MDPYGLGMLNAASEIKAACTIPSVDLCSHDSAKWGFGGGPGGAWAMEPENKHHAMEIK